MSTLASGVGSRTYFESMATFITGTHHCPDCGEPQTGSRAFAERHDDGTPIDWCAFICPSGHEWARPGMQAVK